VKGTAGPETDVAERASERDELEMERTVPYWKYIKRIVDDAPPFSAQQKDELRAILAPAAAAISR
jgi:hypothetical protein